MMNKERILNLFKNFAGDVIDLHGLKCIPVSIGKPEILNAKKYLNYEEYTKFPIQFEIKNPNKVSYFYSIVQEELLYIVEEFGDYVNHRFFSEVLWDNQPKFYLNSEVRNKIQKVFDSFREIKFTTGTPFVGYKRYVIEIDSVGMRLGWVDGETYYIDNSVNPISATLNGENVDVGDAVEEYVDGFLYNKETYYETENYYIEIDSILNTEPLLRADWVATYYNTKFIL